MAITGCGLHSPRPPAGTPEASRPPHDGGGRYCEWTSLDISVRLLDGDVLIIAVNTEPFNVSSVLFDVSALTDNLLERNGVTTRAPLRFHRLCGP